MAPAGKFPVISHAVQYVVTQAKLLMDANPKQTVKEVAYQLGFPSTANFCRYFKRATGIYPQAYKEQMAEEICNA